MQQISDNGEYLISIYILIDASCVSQMLNNLATYLCIALLLPVIGSIFWKLLGGPCSIIFFFFFFYLLASVLVGHPFHGPKKVLWLALNREFFWNLWGERNDHIFNDISLFFFTILWILFFFFFTMYFSLKK